MVTANTKDQLMRDTVICAFSDGVFGTKNTAFSLDIPEKYAMEIHTVDFLFSAGASRVTNRQKFYLVDDPDEENDPGHAAEKVIQSAEETEYNLTSGHSDIWAIKSLDCHRTMVVKNPNFIAVLDIDPTAAWIMYCRIWFKFVKISPEDVIDLLRQQQY